MKPHRFTLHLVSLCLIVISIDVTFAQKKKAPPGGHVGVVVDERLSALRTIPELTGKLIRRIGRGRLVAIRAVKSNRDGIGFYFVNVSSRTHGWIQREAVVSASHPDDDRRLLELIKSSVGFDLIARARIFLDHFLRSSLRPEVLLLLGDAAERACEKLSKDAAKRIGDGLGAPEVSFFLNYSGLDRYNRLGVTFVFDQHAKRLHYDGLAWRVLVRRFPRSREAPEAKKRLAELDSQR